MTQRGLRSTPPPEPAPRTYSGQERGLRSTAPARTEPEPEAAPTYSGQERALRPPRPTKPLDRTARREAEIEQLDSSVEWSAELVQPLSRIASDSVQPLIVRVTAPIVLDDQVVEILAGGRWGLATWKGEPGQVREAVTFIGTNVPAASSRVYVRVKSEAQAPILSAGRLRVSLRR